MVSVEESKITRVGYHLGFMANTTLAFVVGYGALSWLATILSAALETHGTRL